MTAYDWCVLAAVGALTVLIICHLNRAPADEADDRAAWQASTSTQAEQDPPHPRRTEDDVRRDLADAKVALEIAQLYEIWPDPPRGKAQLPHQTRRTEEDR